MSAQFADSPTSLDEKIRKVFQDFFRSKTRNENVSQKFCLDSDLAPEQLPIGVKFLSRKFKLMLGYLLLLHYYPLKESVRCYLIIDLEDLFEEVESFWLSVLMDKELFLQWLLVQETITPQVFFSGICNKSQIAILLNQVVLRFEQNLNTPVRRTVWRKGYRDKGTLPDYSHSVRQQEIRKDYYLSALQVELENRNLAKKALCSSLREFLTEGRVLTSQEEVFFRIKKGDFYERDYFETEIEDYCKSRETSSVGREESESSTRNSGFTSED